MTRFDPLVESLGLYVPALWRANLAHSEDAANEAIDPDEMLVHGEQRLEFDPHYDPRDMADIRADLFRMHDYLSGPDAAAKALLRLSVDASELTRRQRAKIYHHAHSEARHGAGTILQATADRPCLLVEVRALSEIYPLISVFQKLTVRFALGDQLDRDSAPPDRFGIYPDR